MNEYIRLNEIIYYSKRQFHRIDSIKTSREIMFKPDNDNMTRLNTVLKKIRTYNYQSALHFRHDLIEVFKATTDKGDIFIKIY